MRRVAAGVLIPALVLAIPALAAGPGRADPTSSFSAEVPFRPAAAAHPDSVAAETEAGSAAWGRWTEERTHTFSAKTYYHRVDGLYLGGSHAFRHPARPFPRTLAEAGYATSRERWLYSLNVEQPLFRRERLRIGGGLYRLTRMFDFDLEIVGARENTLAALFLKQDYREYFEGRGGHLFAALDVTGKYRLGATYRAERERALRPEVDWAVFGGHFRPNPGALEGRLRSMTVTLSHDSRPKEVDDGVPFIHELRRVNRDWVRLAYRTSGARLGGDFDYADVRLDARGYWKLSPDQFLSARLLAGKEVRGRLPVQNEFYAGGISTLRAHAYKAFRGDRLLLLNVEYAVDLFRAIQGLLFTDLGRAWYHREGAGGPRMPIDSGLGVQTRDERLRLFVGKDTRDSSSPLFVTIRTNASF